MVLALTVTLTVTAFAAGGGSITVENPKEGETYTAYRIFAVKYNEDKTAYSYTIAADSQWLAVVQGYAGVTLSDAVTDGDGNTFYIVTKNDDFSAAAFAKTLQGAMEGKTGVELTAAGGKVAVTGLELGYYFVSSTNGALCNLTTTNPDATIFDKNDVPFEKTADDISVEVGQTVAFVITGKVPDTTGFDTYTFEISDTMSSACYNYNLIFKLHNNSCRFNYLILFLSCVHADTDNNNQCTKDLDNRRNLVKQEERIDRCKNRSCQFCSTYISRLQVF